MLIMWDKQNRILPSYHQKKDNGIDNVSNIAGLCYDCHYGPDGVHNSINSEDRLLELKNGLKQKYQIGLLNSVIPTLIEDLISFSNNNGIKFSITNGLETFKTRKLLDNFRVLSYLYDNKNKDNLVKITQTELSKELVLSRGTINAIFKQLKEKDYLVHDDSRVGRYYLTDKAVNVVEMFRKTK